jgi:adenylate cyclase
MTEQRRLAAIVSADVAGYSRLMGRDESGTLTALKALRQEVVDPAIASHGGRIVKTTGDGMLLEFPSVVNAVRCCIEVQTAMAGRASDMADDRRIAFRIGINIGDIIVEGDDIFGDGVNVAARLQEIAAPGGICVSSRVHEDVRDRLDAAFDEGGTQALKNIARPVQVWRWQSRATVPSKQMPAPVPLPLPDKPSIAVLPFQNMSGDQEQEYFVDGLVEDIITALSRFKSLFVIARNSSFAYKGKSPDVRQVGLELGVRYVLEGSVRKAGNRLRITAQLIDANTGTHAWADRFEGALEDVFALQDEVTVKVVVAIEPQVERAEIARARRTPRGNTDAYDCYLRGLACLYPVTVDGLGEALRHFENTIALEPDYALPYAMSMWCRANRVAFGLVEDIERERSEVARLWRVVERVRPDDGFALSQAAWAVAYLLRDLVSAKDLIDQAVELNPNLATAWTNNGWINVWLGHPEVALEHLGRAERLDPGHRALTLSPMAHAYFFLSRYAEAVLWPSKCSGTIQTTTPPCVSEPPVRHLMAAMTWRVDWLLICNPSIRHSPSPASGSISGPIRRRSSRRSSPRVCASQGCPNNRAAQHDCVLVAVGASARMQQRVGRHYLDLRVLQQDRFRCSSARDLKHRLKMTVGVGVVEADGRLDRRTAEMPVEDCLRSLQPNALVVAVEQLAKALYSARRQLAQRSLDLLRDARPASRIGTAAGEPVSALVAFHPNSP